MLKLILLLAAAIPILVLVKRVFFGRSKALQAAMADFRKQVDYVAGTILVIGGCAILYALGKLVYALWN